MALRTALRPPVKPSVVLTGPRPRRRRRWPRRVVLGVLFVVLVAAGIGVGAPSPPPPPAEAAARRFLDAYVDPDGRVVRRDQSGDTVSEGQAHALLLTVALGDRATFEQVWDWTGEHLQRPNGRLARRWAGGGVRDATTAAGADVDAAHALLLAADRFDEPRHLAEGLRIAEAVRRGSPADPLALDPRAFAAFESASGSRWWGTHRVAHTRRLDVLLRDGTLAVDELPDGAAVRLAAACDHRGRALAANLWPALAERAARDTGPPSLVAAAAAAGAAGALEQRAELLDRAEAADAERPSHDGAAWVALGRILLGTEDLGTC